MRVECGESGPLLQVTWGHLTWSIANPRPPVLVPRSRRLRGAVWSGCQEALERTEEEEKAKRLRILFSNGLSKNYVLMEQGELRGYTKAGLKVFYEEELDVSLMLFNEVLDRVFRIDRIFRQPPGHLLLLVL